MKEKEDVDYVGVLLRLKVLWQEEILSFTSQRTQDMISLCAEKDNSCFALELKMALSELFFKHYDFRFILLLLSPACRYNGNTTT